jgi:Fe-S-cluster containining protein
MASNLRDSVDKVIMNYFASMTAQPFTYHGVRYDVPKLTVVPELLRTFICYPFCGGCCRAFTLDYLPGEPRPDDPRFTERMIDFNGYRVPVFSDLQAERVGDRCRHLSSPEGRCGIHALRPFSCDFELIRFMYRGDSAHMSHRPFARGWNMIRLDGGRGAMCEFGDPATSEAPDVLRKLRRLQDWAAHFGLMTRTGLVMDWVETIKDDPQHAKPLVLPGRSNGGNK